MPHEYTIHLAEQEILVRVAEARLVPGKHVGTPPDGDPQTQGHVSGAEAWLKGVEILGGALAEGTHELPAITITEAGEPVFETLSATLRYSLADGIYIRELDRAA